MIPRPPKLTPPKEPTETDKVLEALTKLNESISGIDSRLKALEAPAPKPKVTRAPAPNPMEQQPEAEWPTEDEVVADPVGVMRKIATRTAQETLEREAGPAAASAFQARVAQHHNALATGEKAGMYKLLKKELDTFITEQGIPLHILAADINGENGVERAFNLVLGQNINKVMSALKSLPKEREKQAIPQTERGGPRETPELEAAEVLTEEEQAVARTMNMSNDEYLSSKKNSIITTPDIRKLTT